MKTPSTPSIRRGSMCRNTFGKFISHIANNDIKTNKVSHIARPQIEVVP